MSTLYTFAPVEGKQVLLGHILLGVVTADASNLEASLILRLHDELLERVANLALVREKGNLRTACVVINEGCEIPFSTLAWRRDRSSNVSVDQLKLPGASLAWMRAFLA